MVHLFVVKGQESVRTYISRWEQMSTGCSLVSGFAMTSPPSINLSASSSVDSIASFPIKTEELNQQLEMIDTKKDGPMKPKRYFLPLSLSMDDVSGRELRVQKVRNIFLRNSISSPYLYKTNQHFHFPTSSAFSILPVQSERTYLEYQRDLTNEQNLNSKMVVGLAQEEMQAKLHWLFTTSQSPGSRVNSRRQSPCLASTHSLLQTKKILLLGLENKDELRSSSKSLVVAGQPAVETKKKEGKKYVRSWSSMFSSSKRRQSTSSTNTDSLKLTVEEPKKSFFQPSRKQSLASALNSSILLGKSPSFNPCTKDQRYRRKSEAIPSSTKLMNLFSGPQETPTTKRRFHFRSFSRCYKPAEKAASTQNPAATNTTFMNSPVLMLRNAIFPVKQVDTSPEQTPRKLSISSSKSLKAKVEEGNDSQNRSRSMSNAFFQLEHKINRFGCSTSRLKASQENSRSNSINSLLDEINQDLEEELKEAAVKDHRECNLHCESNFNRRPNCIRLKGGKEKI